MNRSEIYRALGYESCPQREECAGCGWARQDGQTRKWRCFRPRALALNGDELLMVSARGWCPAWIKNAEAAA